MTSLNETVFLRGAARCNLLHTRLLLEDIVSIRDVVVVMDDLLILTFDTKSAETLRATGSMFINRSKYFFGDPQPNATLPPLVDGASTKILVSNVPLEIPVDTVRQKLGEVAFRKFLSLLLQSKVIVYNVPLDIPIDTVRQKFSEVVPIISVLRLPNGNRRDSVHRRVGRVEVKFFTRIHAAIFMSTVTYLNHRCLRKKYAPSPIIVSPVAHSETEVDIPPPRDNVRANTQQESEPVPTTPPQAGPTASASSSYSEPGAFSVSSNYSAPSINLIKSVFL